MLDLQMADWMTVVDRILKKKKTFKYDAEKVYRILQSQAEHARDDTRLRQVEELAGRVFVRYSNTECEKLSEEKYNEVNKRIKKSDSSLRVDHTRLGIRAREGGINFERDRIPPSDYHLPRHRKKQNPIRDV